MLISKNKKLISKFLLIRVFEVTDDVTCLNQWRPLVVNSGHYSFHRGLNLKEATYLI